MTLTDFLLARIAEDRARCTHDNDCLYRDGGECDCGYPRAVAECEAKRRIVELHTEYHVTTRNDGLNWDYSGCSECSDPEGWEPPSGSWFPCQTLRALAAVYSDHPDYQQVWVSPDD